MPGLRDILDAATQEGVSAEKSIARTKLNGASIELAALCLDMADAIRELSGTQHCAALLARLDRIGKEQT